MSHKEINNLIELYLDALATPDQQQQLRQALADVPTDELSRRERAVLLMLGISAPADADDALDEIVPLDAMPAHTGRHRLYGIVAGVAAVVALALLLPLWLHRSSDQPTASITSHQVVPVEKADVKSDTSSKSIEHPEVIPPAIIPLATSPSAASTASAESKADEHFAWAHVLTESYREENGSEVIERMRNRHLVLNTSSNHERTVTTTERLFNFSSVVSIDSAIADIRANGERLVNKINELNHKIDERYGDSAYFLGQASD